MMKSGEATEMARIATMIRGRQTNCTDDVVGDDNPHGEVIRWDVSQRETNLCGFPLSIQSDAENNGDPG